MDSSTFDLNTLDVGYFNWVSRSQIYAELWWLNHIRVLDFSHCLQFYRKYLSLESVEKVKFSEWQSALFGSKISQWVKKCPQYTKNSWCQTPPVLGYWQLILYSVGIHLLREGKDGYSSLEGAGGQEWGTGKWASWWGDGGAGAPASLTAGAESGRGLRTGWGPWLECCGSSKLVSIYFPSPCIL